MIKMFLKGPWAAAASDFASFAKKLESAATAAMTKEAHEWAKEMRDGIRTQSSARRARPPWPPLASSTIARKGSSKMLIDTGTLVRAIVAEKVSRMRWHVGVRRGARTRDGQNLVNIAAVHELGSSGRSKGGGVTITIPKRQFIAPVARKMARGLEKRLWKRLDDELSKHMKHRNMR